VVDADRLPLLWINPVRARQLFSNLVHNAAAHAGRPDVRVAVRAAVEPDGSLELSVADNGVGVPADYREKVFGVFERLDRDGSGGTGIGLPICRKIVEHLGGRIWFADSAQGADLHLTLPATRVAKRASAGAPTMAAAR